MQGMRMIRHLKLKNLLSFGPAGIDLDLAPLNVLIGANGSGKSNLIEALTLLKAAPTDLRTPIREGGGITEWLWKGAPASIAEIESTLFYPNGIQPLRHRLVVANNGQRLEVLDEQVENERPNLGHPQPYFYYRFQNGQAALNVRIDPEAAEGDVRGRSERSVRREDISPEQSILSQRRGRDIYPELTFISDRFAAMQFFREWSLGRYPAPRVPQRADLPESILLEDLSNLGLVLNHLQHRYYPAYKQLIETLTRFNDRIENLSVALVGGTVQLYLHERGLVQPLPATRISDGTLRFLCLLTVLLHPEPPPLICIEEPEIGMHPDSIPTIAELLIDAAQRTQLVITTHSDTLISALSAVPEAVIVCEHNGPESSFRRLDPTQLQEWLERYRLGELWRMGEIGGTRW
ncbi:MAG: AAA family ATPase [Chloroflexales bacterium]